MPKVDGQDQATKQHGVGRSNREKGIYRARKRAWHQLEEIALRASTVHRTLTSCSLHKPGVSRA